MTASYFVFYRGQQSDLKSFVNRYKREHVSLLREFPGIKRIRIHTPLDWHDPCQTTSGEFALIAEMEFESLHALESALQSEARVRARADIQATPPPTSTTIWHQAMHTDTPLL